MPSESLKPTARFDLTARVENTFTDIPPSHAGAQSTPSTMNSVASSAREAITMPRSSARIRCTRATTASALGSDAGPVVNAWPYLFA